MNLRMLLAISCVVASLLLQSSTCLASEAPSKIDDGEGDDEYYVLENMSDEELEEICTSRGFELVREVDEATGQPIAYTHQDYVDAAGECLQIEADLEEILQTHPEILEDVQRESERMMDERDRLLEQLREQNATTAPDQPEINTLATDEEMGDGETIDPGAANTTGGDVTEPTYNKKLTYDFKEITMEVIAQIKSDVTKVINLVLPRERREKIQLVWSEQIQPKMELIFREHIQPALKSLIAVAKGMGTTAYDMGRRYVMALMDRSARETSESDQKEAEQTNEAQKVNV